MKAVPLLFLLAIAAPLLALLPIGQDPQGGEWAEAVDKAANARHYGVRLATARKIAAAGAEPVPAIEAWSTAHGRNALPATLVDTIAQQDGTAPAVVDLLLRWANDREFYWRTYAFYGLAHRAAALPDRRDRLVELFRAHRDDPAWLVATYARFGLVELQAGDDATANPHEDPRIATKLAALLLENDHDTPLQPLIDALADERTFLGDPWGQRRAADAHRALKAALGDDHPGGNEDKVAAITAVRTALEQRFGSELDQPALLQDAAVEITGGIEVLSCRNGDLFVEWTADGRIFAGIDARFVVALPTATWQELSQKRAALALGGELGVVVCDKMRLKWSEPELHVNVAPASLPTAAADWLLELANALAAADKTDLADAIRGAVEQFASR
ncbi:MAG: hypothetical protein KDE27_33155 [Planctomycetes bacterium]|nr:hypothetical protein [Planctomycetota bacterium]